MFQRGSRKLKIHVKGLVEHAGILELELKIRKNIGKYHVESFARGLQHGQESRVRLDVRRLVDTWLGAVAGQIQTPERQNIPCQEKENPTWPHSTPPCQYPLVLCSFPASPHRIYSLKKEFLKEEGTEQTEDIVAVRQPKGSVAEGRRGE